MENRIPRQRLVPLLVVLLTAAAFATAVDNEFVNWDDDRNFVENPHWRGLTLENVRWMLTTRLLGPYQPVAWLSLGLDYELFGDGPLGPHLGNVVYHALAALMVYFVARRLIARALGGPSGAGGGSAGGDGGGAATVTWGAFVAALAFGLHPLRVESVAWATERRDVLSGFLLGATVLLYLRAVDVEGAARWRRLSLALVVYLLSLGAKAIGMTLPLVLLILDAWPLRRLASRAAVRACLLEKLVFAVPALAVAWVAVGGQAEVDAMLGADQLGLGDRVRIASYATWFYVARTLWPQALWPHYQIPLDLDFSATLYTLAVVGVVAFTALAVVLRRRAPALLASWSAYLIVLAPVSGLTIAGRQIAADRYSYLPGMVFGLMAGWVAVRVERGAPPAVRRAARGIALLALGALAARTLGQADLWRDSRTLWTHVLLHEPDSVPARNNLAHLLVETGEWDVALVHYEAARRLAPAAPALHLNLGVHYDRLGRTEEAFAAVERAAELDPDLWNARFFLGAGYRALGRHEEALGHLVRAAELRPGFVPGRVALAQGLAEAGQADEAAREVEGLLTRPDLRPPQFLALAGAALRSGRPDLARRALDVGLAAHPGHPELTRRAAELRSGSTNR